MGPTGSSFSPIHPLLGLQDPKLTCISSASVAATSQSPLQAPHSPKLTAQALPRTLPLLSHPQSLP